MSLHLYQRYIDDVMNGDILCGKKARQAVERQVRDLQRADSDDFPYYFNEGRAAHVIDVFMGLRHTEDVYYGKPFDLQPWQAFILAVQWGWYYKGKNQRRFFKSFIMVPRKNGKSQLKAGEMVYSFLFDGIQGGQVYSVATARDQAEQAYKAAYVMLGFIIEESFTFKNLINYRFPKIIKVDDFSIMQALSKENRGSYDGKSPSYALIDELHAHPTREAYDAMDEGTASRANAMLSSISTAGFDKQGSPCYEMQKVYEQVLDGTLTDENTFVVIFDADEDDDPFDEITWRKANPNWGVSIVPEKFRASAIKAKNEGGAAYINFLVKRLNVWTDTAATWIPSDIIDACADTFSLDDMKGRDCFAGLDLAAVYDLNALALFFPAVYDDEPHRCIIYTFIGEDSVQERVDRDHVDYYKWIQEGWIDTTPGVSTNYKWIKSKILDIQAAGINIVELAYDRWNCYEIIAELQDEGFKCEGFGQGFSSMSTPTKEIDKLFRAIQYPGTEQIRHNGNPVLKWAFSNVCLKIDPAGNYKVDKSKSSEKVDPVVALIMAYGQYINYRTKNEAYDVGIGVAVI